ncbi:MAG: fimbrillin family protein [Clostridium sp.]|nr:fimbrillin family protein [Bacteroides sp.]MCM1197426.1 fimbrillin family protein [Clostridium sp.]
MKKFLSYVLIGTMIPAFAAISCKPQEIEPEEPSEYVTFRGSFAATEGEDGMDYTWQAESDRIGVFASSDKSGTLLDNAYFSAVSSSAKSRFTALNDDFLVCWEDNVEYDFHAYFPWRKGYSDMTSIPVTIAPEQTGKPGTMPKKDEILFLAPPVRTVKQPEGVALEFSPVFSIVSVRIAFDRTKSVNSVKIECDDADGTMAFTEGKLDLSDGQVTAVEGRSNSVTFIPENPLSISRVASEFNFIVAPGLAGKKLRLKVDCDGNEEEKAEFDIPEDGLKAGHVYRYEYIEDHGAASTDLSASGTANTYIVDKASTSYYFDASVKGNGIERTYTWIDQNQTKSASYSMADLQIEPVEARLVWYNTPMPAEGVNHASPVEIESVYYDEFDRRIYFETPENFVEGNVLIAAYDAGGDVIWSWNIWAVKDYNPDALAANVNGYLFMDRNLGAIRGKEVMNESNDRTAAWAIGHYYQWGKKDPYPAAAECNMNRIDGSMNWGLPTWTPIEELQQDYSSKPWGAQDMMYGNTLADNVYPIAKYYGESFSIGQAVEAGVKYPYKWVTSGPNDGVAENNKWRADGSYTWMMNGSLPTENVTDWHWLWGGPGVADNDKSIYDPCPAGWKAAPPKAYKYALEGSYTKMPHGVLMDNGLFFPYAGQRQSSFGGSQITGLDGTDIFLGCSGFTSGDRVHPYRGYLGGITTGNSYAGAGYQMRCVKEEKGGSTSYGVRAVVIGDSITEVWESRTDNHNFFKDNNYLPKGISGQTSGQIMNRFENDVLMNDPLCVAITCGVNDLAGNDNNNVPRTPEEVFNNIKTMAEIASAAGIKVVIGATPPTNWIHWVANPEEWNAKYPNIGEKVIELNGMLRAYAKERGFVIAEYWSALVDEDNDMKEEYRFTGWGQNDHVHPNAAAYAVMEPILRKAIDKAINPDGGNLGGNIDDIDKIEW